MRMVINNMFVYHFVDPVYCEKDAAVEQGDVDFETGLKHLLHTCIGDWRKFQAEPFLFFGDQKEQLLKTLLIRAFILWLFNCFDFPSYGSELRKTYTLCLLLMCLEAEGLEGEGLR